MRAWAVAAFAALWSTASPAVAQDPVMAATAARELREMCDTDRAQLWGVDLCGPLLVADAQTRGVWASQPDWTGSLTPGGSGWTGTLPAGVPIANTSVDWADTRWIMVLAPLPEDEEDRRVLVAHESWHRIQDALGLPQGASDCTHLETERGRYLLRLEMRALATAMRSRGNARRDAGRDALYIRNLRHSEFLEAGANEAALDRNEGLASYTGVMLGIGENARIYAASTLDRYDDADSYARTYAYATGPAYGILLDTAQPSWRQSLGRYAPADLLRTHLRPPRYDPAVLEEIAQRYGGAAIAYEERTRTQERAALIASLEVRYAQGPRLALPIRSIRMEFDPNRVTPVEGLGTVYATLTARDSWGELQAAGGALISSDFTRIVLPSPNPDGLSGPGWSLSLMPGAVVGAPDAAGVRSVFGP